MSRGRCAGGWCSANLPPPPIRRAPPKEREACAAEFEAFTTAALARMERYAERKARETPEQREAKAARDYVHWLRRMLRRAVDAARWERLTVALDAYAWERDEAKRKADELRERITQRTREVYSRAAAGCLTCAAFLADESTDDLYREAFNEPAAPVQQSAACRTPQT